MKIRSLRPLSLPLALLLAAPLMSAGVAHAADGVPLVPPGSSGFEWGSMENPDLSGPSLAFEAYEVSMPLNRNVWLWNTATGLRHRIGDDMPTAMTSDISQRNAAVADVRAPDGSRSVHVVWQQIHENSPFSDNDIWIWRGDRRGNVDEGFPRQLVTGPTGSHQYRPNIGLTRTPSGNQLVVAWADDRDSPGGAVRVRWLNLSADADKDGVPDYLDQGFSTITAGRLADPGAKLGTNQDEPVVGPRGILWVDLRGDNSMDKAKAVYRLDLGVRPPAVRRFWVSSGAVTPWSLRATGSGGAWLGPGIAGAPYLPWSRAVGGKAGVFTVLADAGEFDVVAQRFALTGGHAGATDGDPDVYYFDRVTGQNVPVCSVGESPRNKLKMQVRPTIGLAPGGARVVWMDSRHPQNTPSTDPQSLVYKLYVALVPTVKAATSRTTVRLGTKVRLTAQVAPDFRGNPVKFQRGKRDVLEDPYLLGGSLPTYFGWKAMKTKDLEKGSTVSWAWKPKKKGTYFVRVWFKGGSRYTDVGDRKVPHVGNTSKVLRIVVR